MYIANMEEVLIQLGLTEKEARLYLILLENADMTAAELAKISHETRTNTYMLLEKLVDLQLVSIDASPVKRFTAVDPSRLQQLVLEKQEAVRSLNSQIRTIMPVAVSKYRLAHHKPGVIYREGLEGLKESFDDMNRVGEEVLVFISDTSPDNSEALNVIVSSLEKRKQRGIQSRGLLHEDGRNYATINEYVPKRNMSVRFLGDLPYEGEVAIYGDKCAFTVYLPTIIVTTITNAVLANTMRTVFENLWQQAKP